VLGKVSLPVNESSGNIRSIDLSKRPAILLPCIRVGDRPLQRAVWYMVDDNFEAQQFTAEKLSWTCPAVAKEAQFSLKQKSPNK
jgi:hypothetical protein